MPFIIKSLNQSEFTSLFDLDNTALAALGAKRMTVDSFPGYPCRVSLEDAEIGEEVILLPYQHHQTSSPYQASGPVFVRKVAKTATLNAGELPKMLNHRLLSLRGYDKDGIMQAATVVEGIHLRDQIMETHANEEIQYLHIHNARPGCYNCLVERV